MKQKLSEIAILFDYDGLLVNSERVVYGALRELFQTYGVDIAWDYYLKHIGTPVSESLKCFYSDHNLAISFEQFVYERNEIVVRYLAESLVPMPGSIDLLTFLSNLGIRMSIVSSGTRSYLEAGLKRFAMHDYFEQIVCIDDVIRGKPHPDLVIEALKRMQIDNTKAVLVDDAPSGIEASNRAGVYSVAVPARGTELSRFAEAQMIVPSLSSLHAFMEFWSEIK